MAILGQNTVEFTSNSPAQTERLGVRLGQLLRPRDVICLVGDLGAGKTVMARGIGRGWGTALRVTSPTFTFINEYPRAQDGRILYHIDCYRLGSSEEAETLGLEDIFAGDGAIMIEWPERIDAWLGENRLTIVFDYVNNTRRSLRFTAYGPRAQEILESFKQNAFGA